jgi:toxin FitB
MKYLLDTCVISEFIAKQPNQKVIDWVNGQNEAEIYLSVITIGEIAKGIEKLSKSKRKTELATWLDDELPIRFSGKIFEINREVMLSWGKLTGRLDQQGKRMAAVDSFIAAIALHNACQLVTRNEADFEYAGLTIINPWKLP